MDDATMQAWMKYATPAEEHEFLKRMAGTWNAASKFWMQPGVPPQESTAVAKSTMVLGDRFLEMRYEGPSPFGPPFSGFGYDGYDKQKSRYVGIWSDSMGTMMMVFEGDVEGDVRTMYASYTDPMSGRPTRTRGVTTIVSENEYRYESFAEQPDGEFFKNMEITFTRA